MDNKLVKILKRVEKPSRYVGGEVLLPPINHTTRVKYCLCFPERYEIAMSDISTKIIYHMLNDRKGYVCERCFAPWVDMGNELKKENMPLFSLETKTPLVDFDVLGFNFTQELYYSNFLYMLDLAGIPFKANQRSNNCPFVYGFGRCMYNPEPLADFLDFAIIGDPEDVTIKVIDAINKAKLNKFNRSQTLKQISEVEGVYVPSFVLAVYDSAGNIKKLEGKTVRRQIVKDLDRSYFPTKLLVPNEDAGCEVARLELMRGCSRGCRYCQEGFVNRPVRERRVQTLVSHATGQIYNSGFSELDLLAPCTKDYQALPSLLKLLDKLCETRSVKLVVPNLLTENTGEYKSLAKSNILKLSIEAGTERLRNIINRNLSDEDIESELKVAFENNVSKLELNFMIGLPFENSEDLMGIVSLVKRAKELYKAHKTTTKPLSIFVHIDVFVPKAFTPFQWCKYIGVSEAEKRQQFLQYAFKKLGVKTDFANAKACEVEALLSLGDRRMGEILLEAYKRGAKFDAEKTFNYAYYQVAYLLKGLSVDKVLMKKAPQEILPWDKIDIGITKQYLANEYARAKEQVVTKDCKHGCNNCGLLNMGVCKNGCG